MHISFNYVGSFDCNAKMAKMIDTAVTLRQCHHSRKHHITDSGNPEKADRCKLVEAGHAQPSTTLAIYTQVYDRRRDEIRNQMSKELYE